MAHPIYWAIVPVGDRRGEYAAGCDGNVFGSRESAASAIPSLAEATETDEDDWAVAQSHMRPGDTRLRDMRLRTDIEHGEGDQRVALVVCRAEDCAPGCTVNEYDNLLAAIMTNGGPFAIDTVGDGADPGSLLRALITLRCDYAELRAAVERAYPPAAEWDWAQRVAMPDSDLADLEAEAERAGEDDLVELLQRVRALDWREEHLDAVLTGVWAMRRED